MAKGKIGALIALDGEKEFKQAVTDCNKSLSTLKSEMSLVKAESDGQANSLEALQKKHDVLTRVLEEQERKQEAVADGLDHAKQSYDKIGSGLQDLKGKLSDATDALEAMKNSSGATEEELKDQEKAVRELAAAVEKGEKNYQTAANRVKDWETKLNTAKAQTIKANGELNKNAAYMKEAEEATDHCATSIDGFGKATQKATEFTQSYTEVIRNNLINTGVDALKGMAAGAASTVLELEDAANQMQASTGATAQAMSEYKSVLEDVYTNNYGDSLESVANALGMIKQYTNETDPTKLQQLTENAITMDDVFGMDLSETIRGVDALVVNMGVDTETAFDYMAKGAQNGLNKSGELADNIAEYSQLWGQAGFSVQEMFTILQNGLDSGAYNLDKVNDFVKEFGNSLADGRIEENLGAFSEETGSLFYAWKQGRVSTKDVFESVIADLGTMTNKQDALTLASTVWSALGEDNAMNVITSLNKVNDAYDDVKGTMESIKEIKYDSLSNKWEELSRKFQMEIAAPVAEDFLPIAEAGLDMLINNMDLLVPAIAGVGTAVAGVKLASAFGLALNPVTMVVGALATGAAAFAAYASNAGEASEKVGLLAEANDRIVQSANDVSDAAGETISNYNASMTDIESKGEYAITLADRIEDLRSKTNRSNAETEVMKQYISQLNEMVPGLNLSYDEQADSLSKTVVQIKDYVKNSEEMTKVKAAEQYRTDLIQRQIELEIEQIKLENEYQLLRDERKNLTSGMSDEEYDQFVRMSQWMTVFDGELRDKKASYEELTESMSENNDAMHENSRQQKEVKEEQAAVEGVLKSYGETLEKVTSDTEENTTAAKNNAAALEAQAAKEAQIQKEKEARAKAEADAVTQVVENAQSQISIFSKATNLVGEELQNATQKTLANMESQKEAMKNWATNLQTLSEMGINDGLLKYLADMGPSGAEYVAQFASMTDEQLKQANEAWAETMEQAGIGAMIAGELTGETKELENELYEKYSKATDSVKEGITDSLEAGKEDINKKSAEVADGAIEAASGPEGFDNGSPSKKMIKVGADASAGIANGILSKIMSVVNASRRVAEYGLNTTTQFMDPVTYFDVGVNVTTGLAQGILSGRSRVVNAVALVCESAIQQARRDLKIHSPSQVFEELGEYSAQGYGIGFQEQMRSVQAAVNRSMNYQVDSGYESAGGSLSENMTDIIENALYNGMISAMSRVKFDSGVNNLQVNVTLGTNQMIEVLQRADDEQRNMSGGVGLFERG